MTSLIIGIDLAKSVFQIHSMTAQGKVLQRRKLSRSQFQTFLEKLEKGCLIAMEACGSSHHWGRMAQRLGHEVRLLPPHLVKPYVAPGKKNDANDAAAIAEAATRPHIKPVPVKTEEQQAVLALHSTRQLLVRQRTALVNMLRAHLSEFGLIAPTGIEKLDVLRSLTQTDGVPSLLRTSLEILLRQIDQTSAEIDLLEKQIKTQARTDPRCQALGEIPGIGPITSSLLAASVPDISLFPTARHFAAWLGLVPRQDSSGGKTKLGRISKTGNSLLRCCLTLGATSLLRIAASKAPPPQLAWAAKLLQTKAFRLVSIALANKLARTVWAVLAKGKAFDPGHWAGLTAAVSRQDGVDVAA